MYNRYAESNRVNWFLNHGRNGSPEEQREWSDLVTPRSVGLILRSITTQYKFPLTFPDRVTVLYKLTERPTRTLDHIKAEALILSERHQRIAARCIEENVIYDYRAARKTQLDPRLAEKLDETYRLQEEARRQCEQEIREMYQICEGIEEHVGK